MPQTQQLPTIVTTPASSRRSVARRSSKRNAMIPVLCAGSGFLLMAGVAGFVLMSAGPQVPPGSETKSVHEVKAQADVTSLISVSDQDHEPTPTPSPKEKNPRIAEPGDGPEPKTQIQVSQPNEDHAPLAGPDPRFLEQLVQLERQEQQTLLSLERECQTHREEIAKIDARYQTLIDQLETQNRLTSGGLPGGTRFQPGVDRKLQSELAANAKQQRQKIDAAYSQLRNERLKLLHDSEETLEVKRQEFIKQRNALLRVLPSTSTDTSAVIEELQARIGQFENRIAESKQRYAQYLDVSQRQLELRALTERITPQVRAELNREIEVFRQAHVMELESWQQKITQAKEELNLLRSGR